jgi:hypothetical protein
MDLSPKDLIEIYRVMLLTRRFEEKTLELARRGWGVLTRHWGRRPSPACITIFPKTSSSNHITERARV